MSFLTIYKASAGSGKTFTLAAKYTAFLLSGESMCHRNLLAVTFTNKATGEMKERILEKLYSIGYGTDDNEGFLCEVRKHLTGPVAEWPVQMLREQARNRLSELIHDYDRFAVQTIDSFFQSLLSNLAHELGLAANFRVEIDDKEVISKAVDSIMQRIATLPETESDLTPEQVKDRQLRRWVSEFIQQLLDKDRSWKITKELKTFAQQLFKDGYLDNEKKLSALLQNNESVRSYQRTLESLEAQIEERVKQYAQKVHDEVLQGMAPTPENENTAYAAAIKPYGGYGTTRYLPLVRSRLKGDVEKEPSATIQKFIVKEGRIPELFKAMEQVRADSVKLYYTLKLSRKNLNHLRLLGEIAKEIETINTEENRFMLNKTPLLFRDLIGESDAPFVMERAGNRFEHVMIDEFQDTSPLQWQNFEKLLINNTAQGNECLLVGDLKQGIYRWRGGDWRKLSELSEQNKETTHNLDRNFRSAENIVWFNNAVFSQAPTILETDWPNDATQFTNKQKGGYVRINIHTLSKEEQTPENKTATQEVLFEDIVAQIRLLQQTQHISLKDIAILMRRRHDADALMEYMRLNHPEIRMVSNEAFFLRSSSAVQRIIAAMRYLRDMGRGPKERDVISEAFLTHKNPLPDEFKERLGELVRMPLYNMAETIVKIFGMEKEKDEAPFIFFFLDQILAYLDETSSSLREFIRYWDETLSGKSIPGGEVDGIRLLTIHKSKGLAFHTVLIPFCNWELEDTRPRNILWCDTKVAPLNEFPVLPISVSTTMKKSLYAPEFEEEIDSQHFENLNLLYVAFTRARQNLLVWGESKGKDTECSTLLLNTLCDLERGECPKSPESISELLKRQEIEGDDSYYIYKVGNPEVIQHEIQEHSDTATATESPFEYTVTEEPAYLYPSSKLPELKQNSQVFKTLKELQTPDDETQRQEGYIHEGLLLHDIFSRIITPEDINTALQSIVREGLADQRWVEQHRRLIESRIRQEPACDWFDSRWQVINEQSIICWDEQQNCVVNCRPDRVITDGEQTIVIDFKFARHNADHFDQVARYCQLLRDMGYSHVKGYLWYIYQNEIKPI